MRAGVEVGGTFTDLVAFGDGRITVAKVRSTPGSPDVGALAALKEAASTSPASRISRMARQSPPTRCSSERGPGRLRHDRGLSRLLFLQRHDRRSIYDIRYNKPEPVLARRDCYEVPERILANGTIVRDLDEAAVSDRLIPALRDGGYAAVAVCLLNGYANPAHEDRLAALIEAAMPETLVTRSSEIVRVFREYERASTTSISAYVQPVIDRYLGRFERNLGNEGFAVT